MYREIGFILPFKFTTYLHLLKDQLNTSTNQTSLFINSLFILNILTQTQQSISFAGTCLTICENTYIFSINWALNELRKLSENCLLSLILVENLLKYITVLELLRFTLIPLFLIGYLQSILWSHWNGTFSFFWRSNSAIHSNISFGLLQIIIKFLS